MTGDDGPGRTGDDWHCDCKHGVYGSQVKCVHEEGVYGCDNAGDYRCGERYRPLGRAEESEKRSPGSGDNDGEVDSVVWDSTFPLPEVDGAEEQRGEDENGGLLH